MEVTLIIVASLNGKTSKGDDPHIYTWTSKEDREFFFGLHKQHNLIVMGRKTYEAAKEIIKPDPQRPRVVMTRTPEKYKDEEVPGLEFSSETPKEIVTHFEKIGFTKMLLVGGSAVTTEFFKAGLLSDIYMTIEPVVFGNGRGIVDESGVEVSLQLLETKQLNEKGSLLLHYKIC